jgi:hypothetical protein
VNIKVFTRRCPRRDLKTDKFKGKREISGQKLVLDPPLGRQDLPFLNLHERRVSGFALFLVDDQLAEGDIQGIRNAPHGTEGGTHLSGLDLAEQADRPFGDSGHFLKGKISLAAEGPDFLSEAQIIDDHEDDSFREF